MSEPPGGVVYAEALLAGCSSNSAPPADLTLIPAAEAAAAAVRLSPSLAPLEAHTRWAVNFRTHCGHFRRFLASGDAGAVVQMGGAAAGVLLKLDKTAGVAEYVHAVTTHDAAAAATTLVSLVALAGGVSHAPLELLRTHPSVVSTVAAMSADERGRYLMNAASALPATFGACAELLRTLVEPTLRHDPLSTVRAATGATSRHPSA